LRHRLEPRWHYALPIADKKRQSDRTNSAATRTRRRTRRAYSSYFEGEETDFSGVRLDLGEQDPFFERIYAAARRVAWGHTTTYGALAKELGGGPEAARDVGQAMARNPVALIIPCHRILAAGGRVGGFSAPGGWAAKIRMLELEGLHVEPPRPAQRSFAF
jgi:methylated-DNA-[protein]-cysteine S-methyltransferase